MSGHSKWSQIKRQKGVADSKRGQVFTKLGNAITIAVREGGGISDPESNFRLRLVVEKARENNMPKENIQRAIERAKGKGTEGNLQEVILEGFAQNGIVLMIEAVTDNHVRTQADVKNVFNRHGGNLGCAGSVSYLFKKSGVITVAKENKSLDEIFLIACDLGCEDVEETDDVFDIYTLPQQLHQVKKMLEEKGLKVTSAELVMKPSSTVKIPMNEQAQRIVDLLNAIEDLDDVQKVYSNLEIIGYEKN